MKLFLVVLSSVLVSGLALFGLFKYGPIYNVYAAEMKGKAILARAQATKQAQIADAEAKYESAKYLKAAADEIQSSLSPEYLQYLQIQMMENVGEHSSNAIYLPAIKAPEIAIPTK